MIVLWLDLKMPMTTAFDVVLDLCHVQGKVRNIILDSFSRFSLRISAGPKITEWHKLEKGIKVVLFKF